MGSTDMPELGSRISLISKADIRYEGKLFTVDPQECTIALANVRSFGTEDRETPHPVPAQTQVYDYILFRATDIKDISVIPPQQLIYDPAIVQLSAPPNLESTRGFGGGSGSGGSGNFNHPIVGSMGGSGGGFQGPSGFNPMQSGLQALAPRSQPPSELRPSPNSSECVLDLISGSRSSTPGRKVSPSVDQGIQAELVSTPKDKQRSQQQGKGNQQQQQQQQQHMQHRNNQQNNRNRDNFQSMEYGRSWSREQPGFSYQNQRFLSYPSVLLGRSRNLFQHPFSGSLTRNIWGSAQGGYGGQGPQQMGGGPRWSGGNRGNGGGSSNRGGGMMQQQQQRNNRGRNFPRAPGPNKKPLKFDEDYDFDKANTEFEELRSELAKVKIAEAEPPAVQQNGETEKKEDSGNETGAGEGEQEENQEVFYDKAKSFFDNISCEAIERSKGRYQRTDWKKERKLNSETFGVAMMRRQGAYRGGRGGGYFQRGGYYQQNRGGSGFRGFRQPNKQPRTQLPTNLEVAKA